VAVFPYDIDVKNVQKSLCKKVNVTPCLERSLIKLFQTLRQCILRK